MKQTKQKLKPKQPRFAVITPKLKENSIRVSFNIYGRRTSRTVSFNQVLRKRDYLTLSTLITDLTRNISVVLKEDLWLCGKEGCYHPSLSDTIYCSKHSSKT